MLTNQNEKKTFPRAAACLLALFAGFCGLLLRLVFLQKTADSAASAGTDERYVCLDVSRGTIYDRALRPLVNAGTRNTVALLSAQGEADPLAQLRAAGVRPRQVRQNGVCVLCETDRPVPSTATAVNVPLITRYATPQLCRHIVGYVNGEGRGAAGLEKAFDRLLAGFGGRVGVRYAADSVGRALLGGRMTVVDDGYYDRSGLVLTIDKRVQLAAESALAASEIKTGAVVVLRVKDSAVLALASVPAYDTANMSASLSDPDLPFLNRALEAYPVGSVFKPFVAAAAIDAAVPVNGRFSCTGTLDVSGVTFSCYHKTAHGETDLTGAIANSCNTYFIDLGRRVGASALLSCAARFGFGAALPLTGTLRGASGLLPTAQELESPAALANFSFGQGSLSGSPLQLAAAYAALARGGQYKPPYLLKAIVDDDLHETAYYAPEPGVRAASAEACRIVCESLYANVQSGTGVNGQPKNGSAAGKTATAQTGVYDSRGVEKLCTWFCGFTPFETPAFVIVVFNEGGVAASQDCAPVFRTIAERILHFTDAAE